MQASVACKKFFFSSEAPADVNIKAPPSRKEREKDGAPAFECGESLGQPPAKSATRMATSPVDAHIQEAVQMPAVASGSPEIYGCSLAFLLGWLRSQSRRLRHREPWP